MTTPINSDLLKGHVHMQQPGEHSPHPVRHALAGLWRHRRRGVTARWAWLVIAVCIGLGVAILSAAMWRAGHG